MSTKKLTYLEFIILAYDKLRDKKYAGLHTVYSSFNVAFRQYFPGDDPVEVTKKLAEEGKISMRLVRGGAIIAPPGVLRERKSKEEAVSDALSRMGLED